MRERIINFLELNGWSYSFDNDYEKLYDKPECFSIGITDDNSELVFYDDSGDFCNMPINSQILYALLGFLIYNHQIAVNYKWPNKEDI